MNQPASLELIGIAKRYGPTVALDDVSFEVDAGSAHALLGENGAGKSTLVKILSGLISPDDGQVKIGGRSVRFRSPRDAQAAGIITAAQELALVPHLSVAQNLFLGREPGNRFGLVSNDRLAREARAIFAELEIDSLDPEADVASLPLAARQQLELTRLLSRKGRVLLLDEPTAALGATEVDWLFRQVRNAQATGVTVVLVSHRMSDVRQLCDSVTVLRNGRHVSTVAAKDTSDNDVVRLMIGRSIERHAREHTGPASGVPVLEVEHLAAAPRLRDATFSVSDGEIVGIAALQDHGQLELFMSIFGAQRRSGGTVSLCGKPSRIRSPHGAVYGTPGVAFVPEDRKAEGVMLRMSGLANLALPVLDLCSRFGWVNSKAERTLALKAMSSLDVKRDALEDEVASLSGGNQQKIAIGKWLQRGARLFLMYEPTRGVDVGAKEEIYELLRSIASRQSAVVVYSTDIEELLMVSDRILVMYRGEIAAEFDGATCLRSDVLGAMLGGRAPQQGLSASPEVTAS